MSGTSSSSVVPGSYNDARVRLLGGAISVAQNPMMFVVLAVLAGGGGSVLFFLAGSGQMSVNGMGVPPAAAKVVGMLLGGILLGAAAVCVFQAFHPGALLLEPARRHYTRHGGLVGKLLGKGGRSGSFDDFQKLRLAHCRNRNPNGKDVEYWRLTLFWKDGMEQNLGCYGNGTQAKAQADGFAKAVGVAVEPIEGGT